MGTCGCRTPLGISGWLVSLGGDACPGLSPRWFHPATVGGLGRVLSIS